MVVRVDKCVALRIKCFHLAPFNMSKNCVKSEESFKYLGRYCNFEMDNTVHKDKLQSSFVDMLTNFDSLSIPLKNKLLLCHRYLLS